MTTQIIPPLEDELGDVLEKAMRSIRNCDICRMLTEAPICQFCASERRDRAQICVLETPADLLAIEQSGAYRGRYFVLMGHLSPIDGIGPRELGLELLESRFKTESIAEVVLATSVTVSGPTPVGIMLWSHLPAASSAAILPASPAPAED